jgi:hypothetical protein
VDTWRTSSEVVAAGAAITETAIGVTVAVGVGVENGVLVPSAAGPLVPGVAVGITVGNEVAVGEAVGGSCTGTDKVKAWRKTNDKVGLLAV